MTRRDNARLAGFSYLFYIAVAFSSMMLATHVRLAAVLTLLSSFCALALAVSLWAITRDQDADLAMLGLTCRVAEGVTSAVTIPASLGAVGLQDSAVVAASCFALGSTLFSWLLLRGRMIPVALAWLGVVASFLLVVALPLQLGGILHGSITQLIWIPMAAFEIPLGFWLLIKGVRDVPGAT